MKKHLMILWLCISMFSLKAAAAEELNVYIWTEYLPEYIVDMFTKETGIKVNVSTYDSNENLYAKMKLLDDDNSYDIVVPSTYFVSKMRDEKLLQEINKSKISNFKYLDPALVNKPFDPDNKYSIPYLWGSTALCYNDKYVTEPVDSWKILFDSKYSGKILLMDDVRDVFHMALQMLGYSGNDTDESHIREAYEKLRELFPHVKIFNSASPKLNYINEEVIVGMNHSGEAFMAARENNHVKYVYPKEGVTLWADSFAIPTNAKHVENAYKFIDFLLRPEISKAISEELGFASSNLKAVELLPAEIRNNPTVYPGKEIMSRSEFQMDVGEAIIVYQKYWNMLKLQGQ